MSTRYAHHLPACVHVEIGGNLLQTRDYLMHLASELSDAYPKSFPPVKAVDEALRAVNRLRLAMDNVSSAELPGDRWAPTIYRGADEDMRQADMQRVMEAHWADNPDCPCIDGNG
ncbi:MULTISPECIES: hypothetical protein [unclassified Micromonospora]|uniref:hypothetical protein n=1 Tax=unclassified Micromonospora TaxID=2617518 RepID=UPI0034029885